METKETPMTSRNAQEKAPMMGGDKAQAFKDDIHSAAQNARDLAREKGHEVTDAAAETFQNVRDSAFQTAEELKVAAQEKASQLRDAGRHQAEVLEERIKKDPLRSVLVATGVGFAIGALWRRS